jgi:putative transcriptional regulator
MTRNAFNKIKAGLEDAIAYAKGDESRGVAHVPPTVDVRAIRKGLKLKQDEFAARYGFGVARLRDWEQGRSRPDSLARAFLTVIERDHEAVDRALQGSSVR